MVSYNGSINYTSSEFLCLNPTFNGRWFHIIDSIEGSAGRECLNPTFNGRWFHIDLTNYDSVHIEVLILLLMEDGFIFNLFGFS